jgi:mono/diheme cytochrome c family protein
MPNWAHLPAAQIQSLVLYVRKLGVDAVRRELDADIAAGQRSRTEADAILAARTVPGPPVAVPPEPPADAASLVRGRVLYVEACAACHGEHGSPPFGAVHVDFDGNRLPATSLRAGMFKGGSEGEQLYVRILKGMDGTAMPAYEDVYSPTDVWHLVHHVLELATRSNEASLAAPDPVPTAASSTGTPTAAPARDSAPRTSPRGGDETDQEVRLLDRWLTVVAVLAGVALLALLLALAIGSAR